jgi:hypothetical protein
LRILIALFFVVSVGCRHERTRLVPRAEQADYGTEQHSVVSAVIRGMYVDGSTRMLAIDNLDPCPTLEALPDPKVEELRGQIEAHAFERLPEVSPETVDDFHARIKQCHPLSRRLDVPIDYVLLGAKELELLFPKNGGYKKFYRKYPHSSGTISFSNPGFNAGFTQAIISTGRFCGLRCGQGYFVLLTKDADVWKIKTKIDTWIS